MRNTTATTYPLPYSKVCDTFRPRVGQGATTRTDLGTKRLVDFLEPRAMLNSLVREHRSEGRPTCVSDAFRHVGFGKFRGRHVADRDVIELSHDTVRELVQKVPARIGDASVDARRSTFLSGSLRFAELFLKRAEVSRVVDGFTSAQGRETLEAKINADATVHLALFRLLVFDADVQKPVAASVAGEVSAVRDPGAGRQITTLEHAELTPVEVEAVFGFLDVTSLERHPSERFLATIAQEWAIPLRAGPGVLLAHSVDRPGVQAKLLAATSSELVQIEPGKPTPAESNSIFLPVVAVIEHERHRAGLLVQQPIERLNAVTVDQDHNGYSILI